MAVSWPQEVVVWGVGGGGDHVGVMFHYAVGQGGFRWPHGD